MSIDLRLNPLESVVPGVRQSYNTYRRNILAAAFRSTLEVTLPNNVQSAGSGSSGQRRVRELAARIRKDVTGDSSTPRFRRAVWNARAGKWVDFEGDGGRLPLVVPKGHYSGQLVNAHKWITQHSHIMRARGTKSAHRYPYPIQGFVATSAASWRAASKRIAGHAGKFLAGWHAAARSIQSPVLDKFLPKSSTARRGGIATTPRGDSDILEWTARNPFAPSPRVHAYTSGYLARRLNSETQFYAERFKKYFVQSVKKALKNHA